MWKPFFVYPVGLTKALSEIYCGSTANNSSSKKYQPIMTAKYQSICISFTNSSYVKNAIWKYVRWNRRKWFWSYINGLYQRATLYWSRQEKTQRNSFQSVSTIMLTFSHPLRKLEIYNQPFPSLFLINLQAFRRLQHRHFPVDIEKFLRTTFLSWS